MKNGKWLIPVLILALYGCYRSERQVPKTDQTPQIKDEQALKLFKIKEKIVPFFKPMVVQKGDWLKSFPENGQTFEEYINSDPTLPTPERRIIYIQPIGEFSATQRKILQLTADYMKIFYNLPVKLSDIKPLGKLPQEMSQKNPYEGQKQIRSGYFLNDLLPRMLPKDAAALICFTNYDLYPDENWNFVFGQATLQNRVGVWSLWRFGNPEKSADDYKLFLMRTLKVAMHETGHMFSMQHCIKYLCLMSGSISMDETDRQPVDVCPEDMAKIAWSMKYSPNERYRNLAEFWEAQSFRELSEEFRKKEKAVQEEAAE